MFLTKCSVFNLPVENAAYLEGYDKGLDKFCSEDSAFSRGFQGLQPEKVCDLKSNYTKSYNLGVQSFCSTEIGNKDSVNGKSANVFCGTKSKYYAGYLSGLTQFCTYENGFKNGFEGRAQITICTNDLKSNYDNGFKNGRNDFLIKDIKRVQNEILMAEKQLRQVKTEYNDKLNRSYKIPEKTEDLALQNEKLQLSKELNELQEKKSQLEQSIFELQKLINANNSEVGKIFDDKAE